MKLIIANKNYSSWSLRAWLALRATGQSFTEEQILLGQPDTREQILQFSPSGRVPCLIDGTEVVWDSLAIIEYLAESFPQLWPSNRSDRAHARSISAEMHSGFPALRSQLPMNIRKHSPKQERSAEVDADIARVIQIWNECRALHGSEGPYLFGKFSSADAMFAPVCFRFASYGVEPADLAGTYLATMLANPAMREWRDEAEHETAIVAADELPNQ